MECYRCGRSREEVRLLDAILNDEIVKICEDCSFRENIPIINKPTTSQLKESERPYTVKERLRRMAGLYAEEKEEIRKIAKKISDVTLDDLWRRKKEKEMEEKYELSKKKTKPLFLIENFHWHVFMARIKKKLTRKQLAQLLSESETAIKMIENKEIPDDSLVLINKLEQFFGIKLKKEGIEEKRIKEAVKKRLEKKEKPEISEKIEVEPEESDKTEEKPVRILKFDRKSIENITIADLQRMREKEEEKKKLEKQKKMKADELMRQIEKEEQEKEEKRWEEEAEKSLIGDELELE